MVISEVAVSLILLMGAGLLMSSFWHLLQVDPGFRTEKAMEAFISLPNSKYEGTQSQAAFFTRLLERLKALPGVVSIGAVSHFPLDGSGPTFDFVVQGRPEPPPVERIDVPYRIVSPDYFRTMGIPLTKGRGFTESDDADSPQVVVLNQSMARLVSPDGDPVGERIRIGEPERPWLEIVGVVGDIKHYGLAEPTKAAIYAPMKQKMWGWMNSMTLVLKTRSDPLVLAPLLREEVRALDGDLPVTGVQTVEQHIAASVADRRFNLLLLGLFASVALMLAVVGIYGVISYSVSLRTHELGIRMALGARRSDVLGLVMRHGVHLILTGAAVGVVGSIAVSRVLQSLLFEVSATDPATYVAAVSALAAAAMLACYIPARRATKMDPKTALRYE